MRHILNDFRLDVLRQHILRNTSLLYKLFPIHSTLCLRAGFSISPHSQEENVSTEAHKRFLQELWAQSGLGESPPPIDLDPGPVITRSNRGSTKRRVQSWFLSSSSEARPENPTVARLKMSVESQPAFGSEMSLGRGASNTSLRWGDFRTQFNFVYFVC